MPNYQKMYSILCGAASDALDQLPEKPDEAIRILQTALDQTEELYIQADEP